MRKRKSTVESFSSFAQLENDSFQSWMTDHRLSRSMQQLMDAKNILGDAKNFWALYWHKQWRQQSSFLPQQHLAAHLQESCYWAAYKTSSRFKRLQYGLADCFQIALADLQAVLKNFKAERGVPLESFARIAFHGSIANALRSSKEIDVSSKWSLLRKLSRKKFLESLEHMGIPQEERDCYRLAWMCFKQVYAENKEKGIQKLACPDKECWASIAEIYNSERLKHLSSSSSTCDAATIEQWLLRCVKCAREYLYPSVTSLNTPKPGHTSGEQQDYLVSSVNVSLLDELVADEMHQARLTQRSQLKSVLQDARETLKPPGSELLKLYYQEQLSQREIAERLEIKQYTVSRKLSKARSELLEILIQWSQHSLQQTLSADAVETIAVYLEEWLRHSNEEWAGDQ